jgi:hypothetical protein
VLGAVVLALGVLVGLLHLQGVIALPGVPGGPVDRAPRAPRRDPRRRAVDRAGRPLVSRPTTPAAPPSAAPSGPDVLEWSEYDPALDDLPPDPPPAPRS